MPEQSLLTDAVRALVGATSEPVEVEVTELAVERAIEVYGGKPRQFAAGDPVPGYVTAAIGSRAAGVRLPELMPKSILISNELSFERPLRMGETLRARQRIADISERFGGQFGYGIYIRTETELLDEAGSVVASTASTMMQYDPDEKRGGGE